MRSRSRSGPAIGFDPGAEYATDLSPEAARAAPIAVALAEAFSADLDVLNVVHSNDIDHPDSEQRKGEADNQRAATRVLSLPKCARSHSVHPSLPR
jgi:nucleotide-binding universal stress UspA family protein